MKRALLPLAVLCLGAGALVASFPKAQDFPHEAHAGLFPTCVGCHVGAETGVQADIFPAAGSCAACHDGVRQDGVEWSPPGLRASNLTFFHPAHQNLVEGLGESATCQTCHAADDPPAHMAVEMAAPETCLACHAHAAEAHLAAGQDCAVCHVPLARADRLPVERIAAFPRPDSHDAPDFVSRHAPGTILEQASCATCHTRDSCVRCHVNADRVDAIAALEPDERVAALVAGREAEYPLPQTHVRRDWSWNHGTLALAEPARCANCHTQPSCMTCHRGEAGAAVALIATLPVPIPGGAPGVDVTGAGARVHPPGFAERHGAFASSGALQCTGCHIQQDCVACHASAFSDASHPAQPEGRTGEAASALPLLPRPSGRTAEALSTLSSRSLPGGGARQIQAEPEERVAAQPPRAATSYSSLMHRDGSGGYHPSNFMERHATEVFAAASNCQSCHSTEAFCRDCHTEVGLASTGRLNRAFHTAQPLWLLAHGQAARLNLESCVACHAQTDCMACHSTVQGRGVNPHGPGFDADRMMARNRITCQYCHLSL